MQYSMYSTFATKFRCSRKKIIEKYKKNGVFGMDYATPSGTIKHIDFYHGGFRKKSPSYDSEIDLIPKPVTVYNFKRPELIVRMLSGKCELCGRTGNTTKVYQVPALKALKPDTAWHAKMIQMRRKTLVLCDDCFGKTTTVL